MADTFVVGSVMVSVAIAALLVSGCGQSGLAQLKRQLNDSYPDVRKSAAKDLEEMGANAAPAVHELGKCLTDAEPDVRYRSIKEK